MIRHCWEKSILGVMGTAFAIGIFMGQAPRGTSPAPQAVDLEALLGKAAQYCRKLEASILDFVCREEVVEKVDASRDSAKPLVPQYDWNWLAGGSGIVTIRNSRGPARNKFFYDYQCVRENRVIRETRTLTELNGKTHNDPDAPLMTTSIAYRNALLGPVNLFSDLSQNGYEYRVAGTEKLEKRLVAVIEARPKAGAFEPVCLSGKAWVDPKTAEILKIEWTQKPAERAEIFAQREEKIGGKLRLTLRTEFHTEKNAIRFPSKLWIEEAYINERGRAFVRSETNVTYKDFKFFTVEVDVR
jgi:hypothetical protein